MKDIIYRGKTVSDGIWIKGFLMNENYINSQFLSTFLKTDSKPICIPFEVDIKTIGQYIGINDKNDKEIYEGDLCIVDSDNISENDGCFVIEFDSLSSKFVLESETFVLDFDSIYGKEVKVVGNKYDNADWIE